LGRQVPEPLQVSGLVQSVSAGFPQKVPDGSKQFLGTSLQCRLHSAPPEHGSPEWLAQTPVALQVSVPSQYVPLSQTVPGGSWLGWQVPDPLQVSGLVQAVSDGLPHAVPDGSKQLSLLSWQWLQAVS
jgi:hypothetical protein